MMYCTNCGGEINENDKYCPKCGRITLTKRIVVASQRSSHDISDVYAWVLAFMPILGITMCTLSPSTDQLCLSIGVCSLVSLLFWIADINEIKKQQKIYGGWIAWGFVFAPIYLWIRGVKVGRTAPAVVATVLPFILVLICAQ